MRRSCIALALLLAIGFVPSGPATADLAPGGFMSPNVEWVAHIPVDAPGVSAKLRTVDGQKRLYVSGVKGLTIYDVTDPALPIPLGHLALPHWQNEDIQVSEDGDLAIIAFDIGGPSLVVDTSNVRLPILLSSIGHPEHTITCVRTDCSWAYGRSGRIYDLRDPALPQVAGDWRTGLELAQSAHAMNLDAAGYLITDTVPRYMLDVSNPTVPQVVTTGAPPAGSNLRYQHNNQRPLADVWEPRQAGDDDTALRAGELMLAAGETNTTVTCNGTTNGPFATWSLKNFDRGQEMEHLDTFRPVRNGTWTDGDPALNALGCSAHWFDWRDDIVAAAWYEHGTRFLHVDPTNGNITEVGFFQPVVGSAGASYWIDDEHVYTVDYARGIDILRFDPDPGLRPSVRQTEASWLAGLNAPGVPAAGLERLWCRIATDL